MFYNIECEVWFLDRWMACLSDVVYTPTNVGLKQESVTVSNLRTFMRYQFTVSAKNGVSYLQKEQPVASRMKEVTTHESGKCLRNRKLTMNRSKLATSCSSNIYIISSILGAITLKLKLFWYNLVYLKSTLMFFEKIMIFGCTSTNKTSRDETFRRYRAKLMFTHRLHNVILI